MDICKNLRPEIPPVPKQSNICDIQNPETLSPLGRIMLENIALKPFLGLVKTVQGIGTQGIPWLQDDRRIDGSQTHHPRNH